MSLGGGLIARVGLGTSRIFRAVMPDPFVIAVLLLAVAFVLGLAAGDFGSESPLSLGEKARRLSEAFREKGSGPHAWSLLSFAMQMCLVLVSGHVLASAPPVRRVVRALADRPRTGAGAAAMVAVVACLAGLLNWGLGLIVGALLARDVGRSLARRGVPHHYPTVAAAGYTGMMVWHGGLSGSAPLTMTTPEGARRTLSPALVERLAQAGYADGVGLDHTLLTTLNLVVTLGLVVIAGAAVYVLSPRDAREQRGFAPGAGAAPEQDERSEDEESGRFPGFLERTRLVPLLLAGALAAGLWRFGETGSVWRLGLNEIIAGMLALGLVLHGSSRRFVGAVEEASRSCGGIIVQFPIYAAIIAVMVHSGLARALSEWASSASPSMLPLATFASAGVINLFVPSGGGQWAVQGPIVLEAALDAGMDPGRAILAVAYGDQLTNMLQPFWALPLLAITGVKAGEIVGTTALVMACGGAWIALALLVW